MTLINLVALASGGLVGTLLRYKVVETPLFFSQIKLNVIVVNILGSLIAGIFFALTKRYNLNIQYGLLILYGFCGAFTTMSSCVLETVVLIEEKNWLLGSAYLSLNVFLSLGAVWFGIVLTSRSLS